ncbi:MAG: hypothetical protein AB8B83_08295 [Bdellovibrionales bacterium]
MFTDLIDDKEKIKKVIFDVFYTTFFLLAIVLFNTGSLSNGSFICILLVQLALFLIYFFKLIFKLIFKVNLKLESAHSKGIYYKNWFLNIFYLSFAMLVFIFIVSGFLGNADLWMAFLLAFSCICAVAYKNSANYLIVRPTIGLRKEYILAFITFLMSGCLGVLSSCYFIFAFSLPAL